MNRNPADTQFNYKFSRTAAMGAIGLAVAGPLGLGFLKWMDMVILPANPSAPITLAVKFTLDQVRLYLSLCCCFLVTVSTWSYPEAACIPSPPSTHR